MVFLARQLRGTTIIPGTLLTAILALSFIFSPLLVPGITYAKGSAYVRLNQIGYVNGEIKQAILMATGSENGASFDVVDVSTGQLPQTHPLSESIRLKIFTPVCCRMRCSFTWRSAMDRMSIRVSWSVSL